jgi:tRNA uridine 5-carbamoylmethylation protein Kti12
MLKDKEIDYQNDSVMRKIVMDVLEEMNAEKEELLAESSKLRLVLEREATAETSAPRFASEPMEVALPVVLEDDILEVLPDIPSGRTAPPELATTPAEESAPSSSEEAVSTSVPPVEVAVPARVRLQVDNENYMDALKIVKNNPGETEVIVSMEGEDQKLSSITLTHRVRMALEFAGISLSEE